MLEWIETFSNQYHATFSEKNQQYLTTCGDDRDGYYNKLETLEKAVVAVKQ